MPVFARDTLTVAFGKDKAPYVIEKGSSGIYPDVVRAVASKMGYDIQPRYVSLSRMVALQSKESIDVVSGLPNSLLTNCHSDPFIMFRNVALFKKGQNIQLKNIQDLANYSIGAFQQASNVLGAEFSKVVTEHNNYRELTSQRSQVRGFLAGRYQVITMDQNIFNWWFNKERKTGSYISKLDDVSVSRLFEWKENFGVGFRETKLCKQFNIELAKLRASGELDAIKSKYISLNH